ncbi:MAG: zf-TFIIB domain-containing protein [Nitrososphaeraceae archaeon]
MQCPNCSTQMLPMPRNEVNIDYCHSCKGVWLDRGETDKIARIQNNYDTQHYNQYHYKNGEYDDYYYNNSRKKGLLDDLFYF